MRELTPREQTRIAKAAAGWEAALAWRSAENSTASLTACNNAYDLMLVATDDIFGSGYFAVTINGILYGRAYHYPSRVVRFDLAKVIAILSVEDPAHA